ncbi:unnamed protein product [Camellia sinensis]
MNSFTKEQKKKFPVCFPRKYIYNNFLSRESSGRKMTVVEEPILSRLDRLDKILKHLEEGRSSSNNRSPRSSYTSSTGTLTSDRHGSSIDEFSPQSLEKHCRPIDDVIVETELKGTLLERLVHVELRVLKLCWLLEGEIIEGEKKTEEMASITEQKVKKKKNKGGLKQLVKSCVKGKSSSGKEHSKTKSHRIKEQKDAMGKGLVTMQDVEMAVTEE